MAELRDSLGRMGHELKEGIMRSVRLAIGSMQKFAQNHWSQQQENAEQEVRFMFCQRRLSIMVGQSGL